MPKRNYLFDNLDYQIIQALHKDARIPASEIARMCEANERTIRKRIDRLVSEGVVRLTAIIDPTLFGYITAADIFLECTPEHEEAALQTLVAMPEVTYVAFELGSNVISIETRFKNTDQLREFIRHTLSDIPGVTVTRYTLVSRILRNIDEWMPKREDFGLTSEDV